MASPHYLMFQNTLNPNGAVWIVERAAAEHSGVIRMLLGDFDEATLWGAIIPLSIDASDACLSKMFQWATQYKDAPQLAADEEFFVDTTNTGPDVPLTAWEKHFFRQVDAQMLFEMLLAANYLDMRMLYERACQVAANVIRGRPSTLIRAILNVKNEFAPVEQEGGRMESAW